MDQQEQNRMMVDALTRTHALNLGPDPRYDPIYNNSENFGHVVTSIDRMSPGLDFSKMPLSSNVDDRRWNPQDTGSDIPPWGALLSNAENVMRSIMPTQQNADIERSAQNIQAHDAMNEMAKRLSHYQYNEHFGPNDPQYHDHDTMLGTIRRQIPWGPLMTPGR